jgi:hypothetical protein
MRGTIERAAEHSVARGVGFGALAIALTVAGLAGYPPLALKFGAGLCLLMWAVLRLKALRAPQRPYKRTEAWLMLEPRPNLPPEVAQRLVGAALRAALERHARYALVAAVVLWLASLAAPPLEPPA